jgi:hypothetical protein
MKDLMNLTHPPMYFNPATGHMENHSAISIVEQALITPNEEDKKTVALMSKKDREWLASADPEVVCEAGFNRAQIQLAQEYQAQPTLFQKFVNFLDEHKETFMIRAFWAVLLMMGGFAIYLVANWLGGLMTAPDAAAMVRDLYPQ